MFTILIQEKGGEQRPVVRATIMVTNLRKFDYDTSKAPGGNFDLRDDGSIRAQGGLGMLWHPGEELEGEAAEGAEGETTGEGAEGASAEGEGSSEDSSES